MAYSFKFFLTSLQAERRKHIMQLKEKTIAHVSDNTSLTDKTLKPINLSQSLHFKGNAVRICHRHLI